MFFLHFFFFLILNVVCFSLDSFSIPPEEDKEFVRGNVRHQTVKPKDVSEIIRAADGSEVIICACIPGVMSSIQCTLHPEGTSKAIYHQTVTETWHVLSGEGLFWRKELDTNAESCVSINQGTTLNIPPRTAYQFKTTGSDPLKFFIATTPHWPGDQEPVFCKGFWSEE